MDIAVKVRQKGRGVSQFTMKINVYKYDRVVIANKIHATPNNSQNDESSDDFR